MVMRPMNDCTNWILCDPILSPLLLGSLRPAIPELDVVLNPLDLDPELKRDCFSRIEFDYLEIYTLGPLELTFVEMVISKKFALWNWTGNSGGGIV